MPRRILIVDDVAVNRAILRKMLCADYDVVEASSGKAALEILQEQHESISAVLLDIVMPETDGYEVLRAMHADERMATIPVIAATGSTEDETEDKALSLGANDFITKPYNPAAVKLRLRNLINLRESAAIANLATHDDLTSLLNRRGFFEKAGELIASHEAGYYILASFNVDNFKVVNDQYGSKKGDETLREIADIFREGFGAVGGICARIMADNFAVLYPRGFAQTDEPAKIRAAASALDGSIQPLSFCVGRYVVDDKQLPVSGMYDRAVLAAATVKGNFEVNVAYYDESMRQTLLHEREITGCMKEALEKFRFEVWFQPQYNHLTGALIGAESLVRWRDPKKGLIPPNDFIPVFERNGFIYEMDKFVWQRTCALLKSWLDRERKPLPLSVNISRYDILCPDMVQTLVGLVERYDLPVELLRLEITESAFTQSSGRIIQVIRQLIDLGFTVEIDDFGSGYSSLNTLKDVPAQVVKLDMRFLEDTEDSDRGGNIIESVVRMAKWLDMSVIAEGVETQRQADFLKSIGCNYVQGYLYAKPMNERDFEALVFASDKEPKLLALETVEKFDSSTFWNPESMDTLIFSSYVGGACIFEYRNGSIELLRANDKYAQVIGNANTTIDELLRLRWDEHMDADDREQLSENIQRSIETKNEVTGEYCFRNLPGCPKDTYVRSTLRVIAQADDRCLVYCMNENMTAQRSAERQRLQAQQLLYDADEQMRAILSNINGGVSAASMTGLKIEYFYVNDNYYAMFGYTEKQFREELSNGLTDIIDPRDLEAVVQAVRESEENGTTARVEFRVKRRDGEVIWVRSSSSVCRLNSIDDPVHLSLLTDITSEMEANERIRELNENLTSLMNDAPGGYVRLEIFPDGTSIPDYVNDSFGRLLGMSADEVMKIYRADIMAQLHPEDVQTAANAIKESFGKNGRTRAKYRLRHKNGSYVWLQMFGRRTKGEDGKDYLNSYYTDLSEAEKREISFRETMPLLLNAIMKSSSDLVYAKDSEFKYICCSPAFVRFAGMTSVDEVVGKTDFELFGAQIAQQFRNDEVELFKTGVSLVDKEERLLGEDGMSHYLSTSKYLLRDTLGQTIGLYGVSRDITETRSSYAQLKLLTDSIPGGLATYICTPDGMKLGYFNDGLCRISGLSREEYARYAERDGAVSVFEEDRPLLERQLKRLKKNGKPASCVLRVHTPGSKSFKWVNFCAVLSERHANVFIVNAVVYDVSEQKRAEEEVLQAQRDILLRNRLVDDSYASIYVCDAQTYELLYVNGTCAELHGSSIAEMTGKPCYKALRGLDEPCAQCVMASAGEQFSQREITDADTGRHYTVRGRIMDWNGRRAMVEYQLDDTASVDARLELLARNRAMEVASINSKISFWEYDLDEHTLYWGDYKMTDYMGYAPMITGLPQSVIDSGDVHPLDADAFREMYEELEEGAENCECTVRMFSRNEGRYFWNHTIYTRLHDPYYKTRKAIGFAQNVDVQFELKARYEHELSLRHEMMQGATTYYELNLTTRTMEDYRSKYAPSMGAYSPTPINEEFRRKLLAPVYESDRAAVRKNLFAEGILERCNAGDSAFSIDYRVKREDGGICWMRGSVSVINKPNTNEQLAFVYTRDIDREVKDRLASQSIINEEVDSLALVDVRSGLSRIVKSSNFYGLEIGEEFSHDERIKCIILSGCLDADFRECESFFPLASLTAALEKAPSVSLTYRVKVQDGSVRRKNTTAYYLDDTRSEIVLSRRDITEIYEQEREQREALSRAVDAANEANLAKSQFLSRMSHDMRTPMNAIMGLVYLARDHKNPPETMRYLENIDSAGHFLLGLINDVLDLSKMESGRIELHEEPYTLEEFERGVRTVITPLMQAKNINFVMELSDKAPCLRLDKLRFNQIIINLLSNAVKYSPQNGRVEFTSQLLGVVNGRKCMRFVVRDNGCGMSEDFLKVLFDPFSQENTEHPDELRGSGLGLAIVKNLVETMGGTISVVSKPGIGSEFTVELSAYPAKPNTEHEEASSGDLSALKGLRVLLVEDNEMNILVASRLLERKGCVVTLARNGLAAVRTFSESEHGRFQLLLMDVRMPVMDGIQATELIRALERTDAHSVPIIAMSADALVHDRERTKQAGMDDYITKPIEPNVMYKTILRHIKRKTRPAARV